MRRPNILFILSDQHRFDCLGPSAPARTPNLDRLAAEGVRFDEAYTPLPSCCPARASLLTGLRPEAFGELWNYDITLPVPCLTPDVPTWPHALRDAGYRTRFIGKWHVSPDHPPTDFGYETCFGADVLPDGAGRRVEDLRPADWFGRAVDGPIEELETHRLAARACAEIEELSADGAPWHIQLNFPQPHPPYLPHCAFREPYRTAPAWGGCADGLCGKPAIQRRMTENWGLADVSEADWENARANYLAVISQMDDAIGMVLDALDAAGAKDDTLVIYSSDHGDMCGSHGMFDKHYNLYDDIVRVPLLLSWPGHIPAGARRNEMLVHALSLPAAILEAAGADACLPGRSLLPLALGGACEWPERVMSSFNGQQFGLYTLRMLRTRELKYVWHPTGEDELYDMARDPHELRNVAGDAGYAERLCDMKKQLLDELTEANDGLVKGHWLKWQLTKAR